MPGIASCPETVWGSEVGTALCADSAQAEAEERKKRLSASLPEAEGAWEPHRRVRRDTCAHEKPT